VCIQHGLSKLESVDDSTDTQGIFESLINGKPTAVRHGAVRVDPMNTVTETGVKPLFTD
jgi:hypothetical protein